MVGVFAFEPSFLEGLGEELRFVDIVSKTVVFPHVEGCVKLSFGVRIFRALVESCANVANWNFVFLLHRTLIIYNFEVEIFHLLPKTDRDCIGFDSASNRRVGCKHLARFECAEYEVAKSST